MGCFAPPPKYTRGTTQTSSVPLEPVANYIVYADVHHVNYVTAFSRYFTLAAPGGPKGWSMLYFDMAQGVPPQEKKLVLGGEMSMWADTYCSPREVSVPTLTPSMTHPLRFCIG